jgi:flagellar biosynthesis protein FliQ
LAGLLLLASPWLVRVLSEYATAMITRMGTLGH